MLTMALQGLLYHILFCVFLVVADTNQDHIQKQLERGRQILVFGGNGFLGSATIDKYIKNGDNITMVNRGNWYWDSFNRIKPHVNHISCDRQNGIDSCDDLVEVVNNTDTFDVVLDFSAYDEKDTMDAGALLKGKVNLYILISTDSIYDVCVKGHDEKTKETDDERPENKEESQHLNTIHDYGNKKKRAEEELTKHHIEDEFPIVILRLPDVIGPRDGTYRWWIYQVWVKLAADMPMKPVTTPQFLSGYNMSLVYSEDVAQLMFDLPLMADEVYNNAYNLAFEETMTLEDVVRVIQKELNVADLEVTEEKSHTETLYMYPTVKRGPVDITKAKEKLAWKPTSFLEAAKEVTQFYEEAMKGDIFDTQKNELVQAVAHNLYPKSKLKFYANLEKIYDINLNHFIPKDEL